MLKKSIGVFVRSSVLVGCISWSHSALADDAADIGFDRPGIGFSTSILPVDRAAFEQGLPDIVYNKSKIDGKRVKTTVYQADTLIRGGLGGNVELQMGWSGPTWLRRTSSDGSEQHFGYADSSIGLKAGIPLPNKQLSLAFLLATTMNTGDAEFGDTKRTVSFGSTLNYNITDAYSTSLYANVDRYDGHNTWTISPDLSFDITDTVGSFVEYGYKKEQGHTQQSVLGGGFTWKIHPRVQLDLSADFGLNQEAPDLQTGFGVSFVLP